MPFKQKEHHHPFHRLVYVSAILLVFGCAGASQSPSNIESPMAGRVGVPEHPGAPLPGLAGSELEQQELLALWASRATGQGERSASSGFAIGPGDLLRISVPQMEELRQREVRVSEANTVALPLLGEINVAGMSEEDLRTELLGRLGKYMHHPELDLFVENTENREVAVLGSVAKPGRYPLASPSDTLMTMIGRAGGMSNDAASRIILIPGGAAAVDHHSVASQSAGWNPTASPTLSHAALREGAGPSGYQALTLREATIDLTGGAGQRYLELPARPGDTIIVPAAGQVTVEGWVDKPGAFPITSGMTALGAIAAAGGAQFSSNATLIREQGDGGKLDLPLDLAKIKKGDQADVPLRAGDIVVVESSVLGAVPYSLYFLANHFGTGMFLPIP